MPITLENVKKYQSKGKTSKLVNCLALQYSDIRKAAYQALVDMNFKPTTDKEIVLFKINNGELDDLIQYKSLFLETSIMLLNDEILFNDISNVIVSFGADVIPELLVHVSTLFKSLDGFSSEEKKYISIQTLNSIEKVLLKFGDEVIDQLVPIMTKENNKISIDILSIEKDVDLISFIVEILGDLKDKRAVPALLPLLKKASMISVIAGLNQNIADRANIQLAAVNALSKIADPTTIETLMDVKIEEHGLSTDSSLKVREELKKAKIRAFVNMGDVSIEPMLNILNNKKRVDFSAIVVLGRLKCEKAIPIIAEYGKKLSYKEEAIKALKQINTNESKALAKELETKCFIATATYGSPYCNEVQVLREYRNRVLLQSSVGKLFVDIYYFVSPTLATIISKNNWLKRFSKLILDKIFQIISNKITD